jgi:hypothetical protein
MQTSNISVKHSSVKRNRTKHKAAPKATLPAFSVWFQQKDSMATQASSETHSPTKITYDTFDALHDFLNKRLFEGQLPKTMIVLEERAGSCGHFRKDGYERRNGENRVALISLNPALFKEQTDKQIAQTLLHEACHQWQFEHGTPTRASYHNKEWATKMMQVGLMPSNTGKPGGKPTGQKMSDYIIPGGPFDVVIDEWINAGGRVDYVGVIHDEKKRKAKRKSKTHSVCPGCLGNGWAKQDYFLACVACQTEAIKRMYEAYDTSFHPILDELVKALQATVMIPQPEE